MYSKHNKVYIQYTIQGQPNPGPQYTKNLNKSIVPLKFTCSVTTCNAL